jgi:hypothetical protein
MATTKIKPIDPWEDFGKEPIGTRRTGKELTVMELVDIVDGYLTYAAFEIFKGEDSLSNFEMPEDWPDGWLKSTIDEFDERLERRIDLMKNAMQEDPRAKPALSQLSEDIGWIKYHLPREGYRLGILMGAKLMGASKQRLQEIAKVI